MFNVHSGTRACAGAENAHELRTQHAHGWGRDRDAVLSDARILDVLIQVRASHISSVVRDVFGHSFRLLCTICTFTDVLIHVRASLAVASHRAQPRLQQSDSVQLHADT